MIKLSYDDLSPEAILSYLQVGEESPPLVFVDGDGYVIVSRDDTNLWTITITITSDYEPPTTRSESYDCPHGVFGALGSLWRWEET